MINEKTRNPFLVFPKKKRGGNVANGIDISSEKTLIHPENGLRRALVARPNLPHSRKLQNNQASFASYASWNPRSHRICISSLESVRTISAMYDHLSSDRMDEEGERQGSSCGTVVVGGRNEDGGAGGGVCPSTITPQPVLCLWPCLTLESILNVYIRGSYVYIC
ncbi:hypothetical protein TWF481_012331 [Arthrobotrys musiformis]|uniref:Uncharacterized protein n=1 Tax=Arthrobotrys musiformis TaxID=47236 RepID=A0AAV9WGG1_9PEZI